MFEDYLLRLFSVTPRRAKAIFNVLRGRRTVSTLFAGLTYGCLDQLDSWHGVPLERFLATAEALVNQGFLASPQPGYLQLTPDGQQRVAATTLYRPVALSAFQTVAVRQFAAEAQLALQVVSEAVHQQRRYYPVTTDPKTQARVKAWVRQQSRTREVAAAVYAGLHAFLGQLDPQLAAIFVASLTGYRQPGLTDAQLGVRFDRQPIELLMIRKDLTCQWVAWLQSHPKDPLAGLLAPLVKASPVSTSAQRTVRDFSQSGDLNQIAQNRRLKPSTVREHLLEAAILTPRFPFKRVLSPAVLTQLSDGFGGRQDVADWQFAEAQAVNAQLTFFEFRLYQIMRCHDATS
ncbi:helix-turn-helix domain-containing protein [Lactiplantibacillus plajomi]|uniref:Helix-turn-helix domain-containing protein n=1 Tax=Lactiplantibacillus plajomi TaxID=1457217 RepID=A0ABV6K088_9LACO|nr:helix-turn-helix domain-containing protein [Lactiplantibacillus plajomi]